MDPVTEGGAGWITYAINACVVGMALLLAKITGQIVTKSEVFEQIKAASEAVTASVTGAMLEREKYLASRLDLREAIQLAIEAFSKVDMDNDRLMVERYTEPLRVLIDRQQVQQDRFLATLENLNNNLTKLLAQRIGVP